jgi:hypothetical protein
MNGFLIEAVIASDPLSRAKFDPAPDSISTKWPLFLALPFVAFALWLVVDSIVIRIRKRSQERTLIVTDELLTIEHPGDKSKLSSDQDRGSTA